MGKGDPKQQRQDIIGHILCASLPGRAQEGASTQMLQSTSREFSKKCSERWKTLSAKEKEKFEDKTRVDKDLCERA